MQSLNAAWIYPIIVFGGLLQAWGPPMNGALRLDQPLACRSDLVSADRGCARLSSVLPSNTAAERQGP